MGNEGEYVFVVANNTEGIDRTLPICEFKEQEGTTLVLKKEIADQLKLTYDYIASWITLKIHSSLETVGLTAIVSTELAKHNISCNMVAGYYHDHLFVDRKDAERATRILSELSENCQ